MIPCPGRYCRTETFITDQFQHEYNAAHLIQDDMIRGSVWRSGECAGAPYASHNVRTDRRLAHDGPDRKEVILTTL